MLLFTHLNPSQQEAVTLNKESAIILAAAGSGKTTTLINRIAHLVENKDVPSSAILAVTFTNKAASEMKARLVTLSQKADEVWMGTFHSICFKILKEYYKEAGLHKYFQIIDNAEQESLFKKILKNNNVDNKSVNVKAILTFINNQKEKGLRANDINHDYQIMYQWYEAACSDYHVVDFGELLLRTIELFEQKPSVLARYHKQFEYLLVDEFQDTNPIQMKWLHLLLHSQNCIFAVGDDDQSIYSFRGASPNHFQQLRQWTNAKTIKIEENYRSDGAILDVANALIVRNKVREGKMLKATYPSKNKPIEYMAWNETNEADVIARTFKNLHDKEHVPYPNMALLYRTNAQSRVLEERLLYYKIPYTIYGGFRFFERQEIKNVLAYLNLIMDPHQDWSLLRIMNVPTRGIGLKTIEKLESQKKDGDSLWTVLMNLPEKEQKKFESLIEIIEKMQGMAKHAKSIVDYINIVMATSGLHDWYKQDKENGEDRLDNIEELKSAALEYSKEHLEQFLAMSVLDGHVMSPEENEATVKLMTIHASKGLEFDIVCVTGVEDGLIPHQNCFADTTGNALEEERRLLYVAMTRAKKYLWLTYAERRTLYGESKCNSRSRFLKEIPLRLINKIQ